MVHKGTAHTILLLVVLVGCVIAIRKTTMPTPVVVKEPTVPPTPTLLSTPPIYFYGTPRPGGSGYLATVPLSVVQNASWEEIAEILLRRWLNSRMQQDVNSLGIEDYQIVNVKLVESGFCITASYRIKSDHPERYPSALVEEDGWVRGGGFFGLVRDENVYGLVGPWSLC